MVFNLKNKCRFYDYSNWSILTLSETVVISINRITVDYYEPNYSMGQLLTLMVFGDTITIDNADDMQQSQQLSTAGRSAKDTRYHAARRNDGDFEQEEHGALIPGPTGLGTDDPEIDCDRANDTTDESRQDEESGVDGAGHCGGELRRDLSALESWTCTVHQHRTGLVGDGRRTAGSSGIESGRDDDDDGGDTDQRQLMDIMNLPDRQARLCALRRYLAATVGDRSAAMHGDHGDRPPDPRLATGAPPKNRQKICR